MTLGTLGKIIFIIFLIDMGLYLFAPAIGTENVLLIEDDLFRRTVDPVSFERGNLTNATIDITSRDPEATQKEGGAGIVMQFYDVLKNSWIGLSMFTAINIFAAPFTLMTALTTGGINMPREIAIIIFAPMAILLIIGFVSFVRGKDV